MVYMLDTHMCVNTPSSDIHHRTSRLLSGAPVRMVRLRLCKDCHRGEQTPTDRIW